jgi:hypothetical protein
MYRRFVSLIHFSGSFIYAFELVVRVTSLGEGKRDVQDHDTIDLGHFWDNYKSKSWGPTYACSRNNDADISNVSKYFFIHQLMHKWIVLETILKFTLKLI